MNIKYLLLLFPLFLFTSCGDNEEPSEDTPITMEVTGKIRGVDFTFGSGRYIDFETSDDYTIRMDNAGPTINTLCDTNSDDVYIVIDAPKMLGRTDVSSKYNISLNHPDHFQNLLIEGGGYIDIISVNDDEMVIEIDARRNDDNFIKGRATVANCM